MPTSPPSTIRRSRFRTASSAVLLCIVSPSLAYYVLAVALSRGVLERRELPIFSTVVEGEALCRETKALGGTQLLGFGGEPRRLVEGGVLVFPSDWIGHRSEPVLNGIGDRQAAMNPVKMQVEGCISKSQEVRQKAVKDTKGWDLLDHGLERGQLYGGHFLVNQYHPSAITLVRGTRA